MIPHATRSPAFPVRSDSSFPPVPKSSASAWMTNGGSKFRRGSPLPLCASCSDESVGVYVTKVAAMPVGATCPAVNGSGGVVMVTERRAAFAQVVASMDMQAVQARRQTGEMTRGVCERAAL